MKRRDGSIQSANLPSRSNIRKNQVALDYSIHRCMITDVFYIDDAKNTTFDNKQVTYEAIILGGRKEGQLITNIKVANELGGQYNYQERIFRKTFNPFAGPDRVPLPEQKGDIVYIGFISGDTSHPIIVGCGTNPLDKSTTGATISDGPIERREFNGVYHKINKNGEYEFIRKGGTYNADAGYFVPADRATEEENGKAADEEFQARLKFADNEMLLEDPNSSLLFKKNEKLVTLTVGKEDSSVVINVDGENEEVNIKTKTGATLKIKEGKVGLGTSTAELLEQFSQTLQELITNSQNMQVETHLGNLGYPTLTPINSSQYATTGAALQAIKDLVDSIKGGV